MLLDGLARLTGSLIFRDSPGQASIIRKPGTSSALFEPGSLFFIDLEFGFVSLQNLRATLPLSLRRSVPAGTEFCEICEICG